MTRNLPALDLMAAGERRHQRLQRLAGKLWRDALAGAEDAEDAALAVGIAILACGGVRSAADFLERAAEIGPAVLSAAPEDAARR